VLVHVRGDSGARIRQLGGETDMQSAIKGGFKTGIFWITSGKVPCGRIRVNKASAWVRQLGVRDCWS
jgi:hypothetical protein